MDSNGQQFGAFLLRLLLGTLFIAHLYWKFAVLPGGIPTASIALGRKQAGPRQRLLQMAPPSSRRRRTSSLRNCRTERR
jgi:hypothetical protein